MYLDTAILFKLVVGEPDSDFYVKLADEQSIVTSWLAVPEMCSATLFKERGGFITPGQRTLAWNEFERRINEGTIRLVPLSESVLRKTNRILEACHPQIALRALDAIHLACCDHAQEWPLVTNDKRMRQAAEFLHFPLAKVAP